MKFFSSPSLLSGFGIFFLLGCLSKASATTVHTVVNDSDDNNVHSNDYIIVGVSGGLQAGFPDHKNLDYHAGQDDEVQAVFLGRGLVRGYKSFLDVMEEDWRQYTPEPDQPLINCNVYPTGCQEHANQYWMYLVDARQFITILMKEPRFLSISPDLGLVDLTVAETSPVVKYIAKAERNRQNKTDASYAGFPIVTAAWFNPTSHVEAPILYTMEDGTEVTNFAESLAVWASVISVKGENTDEVHDHVQKSKNQDQDEASGPPTCENEKNSHVDDGDDDDNNNMHAESFTFLGENDDEIKAKFWQSIRQSVRTAEQNRQSLSSSDSSTTTTTTIDGGATSFQCKQYARFGVSKEMVQVNNPYSSVEFSELMNKGGYEIDYVHATVSTSMTQSTSGKVQKKIQ